MRALLATAAAIAPLVVASGAWAETVITTSRTSPIRTATATGSSPDSIRIAGNGSIVVGSGTAVTIDTSHDFKVDSGGGINMDKSADGSTAILVQPGLTTNIAIAGSIRVTDSIETYPDDDKDGDLDGPWATGSNRYGLRLAGPGTTTGTISLQESGLILVEGNDSRGISIESDHNGAITTLGSVTVFGDRSTAIHMGGRQTGAVDLLGNIRATGEGAKAIDIQGDVDGRLNIQGTVISTGYRYTQRPLDRPATGAVNGQIYYQNLDPDDLLQGGPAVTIGSNLNNGLLFDAPPSYGPGGIEGDDDGDGIKNGDEDDDGDGKKNREDTDRDGDGILDTSETRASITSFGQAPAVLIGSTSRSITLNQVGTGDDAYGFVNRGAITGAGVYDNIDANAVTVGAAGGQSVTIAGGMRNQGEIVSSSLHGNSTAIRLNQGATTPTINNSGTIRATGNSNVARQFTGIEVNAGANLGSITNTGSIIADVAGGKSNATAINDLSGSVTNITNWGNILAVVSKLDDADTVTGKGVAINAANNTTGLTFIQDGIVGGVTETTPDTDKDGVPDGKEPSTTGAIILGSGADVVDIRNGTVNSDISFGNGADRLLVSGGAVVTGAINSGDGNLDINISKGTLDARQNGVTNLTGLNVGADGTLIVTLDPASGTGGGFKVNGAATLADGAGLGVRFNSLITDPTRFTIIDADTLNLGNIDLPSLEANSPYAYVVGVDSDVAAGQLFVDARRRTASEAGMIAVEADAYEVLYNGLSRNEAIRNSLLSQTTRDGFFNVYEQLLPDHSGGPLMSLSTGVDAVTRALTGRNASAAQGETSAWVQEINFYADKDKTDTYGFRSEGFGVAGGVERGTKVGAIGLSMAFTSSDLEDPEAAAEEVLSANLVEMGLYWRAQGQAWTTWARAAAGYAWFDATRRLVADGINLKNESKWNGFTLSAAGGASYEQHFGRLNVRPEVYAEYFSLSEEARSERGGGDGFDLNIQDRDGHIFSGVAAVNIGYGFGRDGWIRPEVRVGYRHNFSVDAGDTIARFASGGDSFKLKGVGVEGGGPILGFRLNVGNELGMLSITGDAELLEDYVRYTLLLRASFRF
ncbi:MULTISPECIES: autotransporter outer membrane beta-barrel domain-containing protein [unclassified Brevundimonas]|uniref:autotransporter outer membrane beta-barrel domain-containing protein n=1 Tax=unclassified Brevundimonas TaxID=2622653 RepID=UPI0025BECD5D|nr:MULTISPECIES: autotransporter domain-containing protein [unclassified Brevundimonas]